MAGVIWLISLPTFPDKDFPVTDFGAIPDGHMLNTEAFRKAITAQQPHAEHRARGRAFRYLFDTLEIKAVKGLVATQAKTISLRDVNFNVQDQPSIQADKTAQIVKVD
jgi:hypothetical protein